MVLNSIEIITLIGLIIIAILCFVLVSFLIFDFIKFIQKHRSEQKLGQNMYNYFKEQDKEID